MEILYSETSPYQHIMVLDEGNRERSLILDGYFQTSMPNNEYWECILGPNKGEQTVILGGGDLTSFPMLIKRGISDYKVVELDKMVVEACSIFATVPRGAWGPHIIIGDAVEYLRNGSCTGVEHIIVDMLAMSRLGALVSANPEEFLTMLADNAGKYISGFTDAGTTGIILNTILQREFYKRGWTHFVSIVNEIEECFFTAAKEPIILPPELDRLVVRYPVYPKDDRLYGLTFNDALIVLKEAK